jgi:acyl-coenzyme A synthetase/AMP-(fatty) acid ligase
MRTAEDPWIVDAMWRANDLTRAYLARDRARVAACIVGLGGDRLERVLIWLSLDHDALFTDLGEPSMGMSEAAALAALAPAEVEFATTTALRRVVTKEAGFLRALEGLAMLDQIHVLAICTAVMLLETYGRAGALERLDGQTAEYSRRGHLRPYVII